MADKATPTITLKVIGVELRDWLDTVSEPIVTFRIETQTDRSHAAWTAPSGRVIQSVSMPAVSNIPQIFFTRGCAPEYDLVEMKLPLSQYATLVEDLKAFNRHMAGLDVEEDTTPNDDEEEEEEDDNLECVYCVDGPFDGDVYHDHDGDPCCESCFDDHCETCSEHDKVYDKDEGCPDCGEEETAAPSLPDLSPPSAVAEAEEEVPF